MKLPKHIIIIIIHKYQVTTVIIYIVVALQHSLNEVQCSVFRTTMSSVH